MRVCIHKYYYIDIFIPYILFLKYTMVKHYGNDDSKYGNANCFEPIMITTMKKQIVVKNT